MTRSRSGYYSAPWERPRTGRSMLRSLSSRVSVIAEFKPRSPVAGELREVRSAAQLISELIRGGADAISVLTEPVDFGGRPEYLRIASELGAPTLMKDFVVSREQLEFASRAGASAVLLITQAFERHLCELELEQMIREAHDVGLEVLLEVYRPEDLNKALNSDADLIGINSRDLDVLDLSLERARSIVEAVPEHERWRVVAESGIRSRDDVQPFIEMGVNKFLVGTALMLSSDPALVIRRIKGEEV